MKPVACSRPEPQNGGVADLVGSAESGGAFPCGATREGVLALGRGLLELRPELHACALARARPSRVRVRIRSRSTSARPPSTAIMSRPKPPASRPKKPTGRRNLRNGFPRLRRGVTESRPAERSGSPCPSGAGHCRPTSPVYRGPAGSWGLPSPREPYHCPGLQDSRRLQLSLH
jgi:hypothetical protein